MNRFITLWNLYLSGPKHPAGEPRKKVNSKRKNARVYPATPSPESNNLRGREDLRYTPAP